MEQEAIETALAWIEQYFPTCQAAIVGGSAITGGWTDRSDLDIVLIDENEEVSYRESFAFQGRVVEAFIFCNDAYGELFAASARKAVPTLQRICAEGKMLIDRGSAGQKLRMEAKQSLEQGPAAWTLDEMNASRYELTDMLVDLESGQSQLEEWLLFHRIAWLGTEFILRVNEQWCGEGKWMVRELRRFDEAVYSQLEHAVSVYGRMRDKSALVRWIDGMLEPYGGRLSSGFIQEQAGLGPDDGYSI